MLPFIKMFMLHYLCANIVYTINCLLCFEELIKTLINGLSLRVVSKPNLLRKVRFEVFRNIVIYPWIKTKPVSNSLLTKHVIHNINIMHNILKGPLLIFSTRVRLSLLNCLYTVFFESKSNPKLIKQFVFLDFLRVWNSRRMVFCLCFL